MHAVTRGMASESHFQNEFRAYMSLKELQGTEIAEFLGHFTIEFDERELHEDRSCRVMILEQIKGPLLATLPASRLSGDQLCDIRDQVLRIVDIILKKDIYFPVLYLDTFKVTKVDDKLRVKLFSYDYGRQTDLRKKMTPGPERARGQTTEIITHGNAFAADVVSTSR